MKRILLGILIAFMIGTCVFAQDKNLSDLKGYSGIYIPEGSFIPVENTADISTEFSDTGSSVRFIGTNDFYLNDVNVLPRGTEFFGTVEQVHEPVIGTNGSMIIKMFQAKYPDGFVQPISGYIYSSTSNKYLIGGELTDPETYDYMPAYYAGFEPITGYLKSVPGASRKKGQNTVIKAGEDRLIILTHPLFITHTLIN
jgi:hypothetical protein